MLQTPATMATNTPPYRIEFDADAFVFVATPGTDGFPVFRGSRERCIRCIAAEQGWSTEDLIETLAYNNCPTDVPAGRNTP